MEPLTAFDVRQMLVHYSRQYEEQMLEEINQMTAIIDPAQNRVKTD